MLKKSSSVLLGALLLGLASCSDENPWYGSDSEGGIKLELSADGRVMHQTRAGDDESPVAPEVDDFSVSLKNADNSYSKSWRSMQAFNLEDGFPIGNYTLSASYGDMDVQGFQNPYFYGQTVVAVAPSSLTEAKIVATLANSMVSIRYTDAFKSNFAAYSASVQSEGHDWVMFAQDETRPAYITPGKEVKLNLTLKDTEGREVTIQPASFAADPRHHYVVTIGVTGATGTLALDVQFEENVVSETVEVSLGDELFTAQPPTVKAVGFEADAVIEGYEGLIKLPQAEYQVFTFGGLSKANLNFETNSSYSPAFGKSVQLVNASESEQNQLANEGIECIGFFKKPEKMGIVRITEFLKRLPAGKHTLELQAVDALTRVSDPVKITVNIQKVQFAFNTPESALFGTTELVVDINTNCPDVKDNFIFRAPDSNNKMEEVTAASITDLQTPGALGYTFRYTLAVKPQNGSEADVEATYKGATIRTTVSIVVPEYTIEPDAFAHHVLLKITSENSNVKQIVDNLKFYNAGTEISKNNISFDAANGIVKIIGLNPGAHYTQMSAKLGKVSKDISDFTTETEIALSNGDFSSSTEKLSVPSINVGGNYVVRFLMAVDTYTNRSSIDRSLPDGWATLNQLTCNLNSSPKNTWYMVPSTWVDNGQAVIQSVGYHHSGETPGTTDPGGAVNAVYYSKFVPSSLNKSPGEMFLGQYTFNQSASRTDGISWTSRPLTLSFDYKFEHATGDATDKGVVYVKVLGAADKVLMEQTVELDVTSTMSTKTISLDNYTFGEKAMKILLGFKSSNKSTPDLFIPTDTQLKEDEITATNFRLNPVISANNYQAYARGSKLTVDNVKFGYTTGTPASAAKRKNSNKRR